MICGLLAFAVFAHGAVEPWSEAVLEIGAALLFVWWGLLFALGIARSVRWNWLLVPVAAFLAGVFLQYFTGITAAAFLTKIEILRLSALAILFFLAIQAFESLENWHGFAWFLLVLGFLVSVLGILQHFTFNGKLYWFRELHYGGIPFGPYVNRNHFAGLIELIVPTGLSILVLRAENRERMPLLVVLTLVPMGALFLSASRGGLVGFVLELVLLIALSLLRGRGRRQLLAGGIASVLVVLVLTGGFVVWLGAGGTLDRFETYRRLEVSEGRRTEIFKDSWRIFVDHPLLGTGAGTLQAVFPKYETLYDGTMVTHSHNDYVEALAETGLAGGVLCAAFLVLLFRGGWQRLSKANTSIDLALRIGAFSACVALLAHSLVDFNLHIPSNALLFLLQCALATSAVFSPRWSHTATTN
jgi:O-antigen ligase